MSHISARLLLWPYAKYCFAYLLTLKHTFVGMCIAVLLVAGAAADPLDDWFAAYDRGDYETAYGLILPLWSDPTATAPPSFMSRRQR